MDESELKILYEECEQLSKWYKLGLEKDENLKHDKTNENRTKNNDKGKNKKKIWEKNPRRTKKTKEKWKVESEEFFHLNENVKKLKKNEWKSGKNS